MNGRLEKLVSITSNYDARLDKLYLKSVKIKCPFWRRRAFETIESMKRVLQFVIARHKSTPFCPTPLVNGPVKKWENLSLSEIASIIHSDWSGIGPDGREISGKGYYMTGKLTKEIYDEQCFFDGPDPDMPVTGLRKYLLFAAQLFDQRISRADLVKPIEIDKQSNTITAYWRIEGVLNLPWHPFVKPWTGSTLYKIDSSGLIVEHVEKWDISVIDAFVSTLFPELDFGMPPALPVDSSIDTTPIIAPRN
eukprot:CAMPEP_0117756386 /NCGR_PEP_ID=MMETSP0947-20121206/14047_1 /TAXON_ID=44440 /ORGANISM="Chattonella subsalsa, Strain CCMP2191" /LENGTH=249 /DNA_ID=CAMNT_0005575963 /DNA_START=256 /DNA_END=1005 /DNA_ORIENTATION=-